MRFKSSVQDLKFATQYITNSLSAICIFISIHNVFETAHMSFSQRLGSKERNAFQTVL